MYQVLNGQTGNVIYIVKKTCTAAKAANDALLQKSVPANEIFYISKTINEFDMLTSG